MLDGRRRECSLPRGVLIPTLVLSVCALGVGACTGVKAPGNAPAPGQALVADARAAASSCVEVVQDGDVLVDQDFVRGGAEEDAMPAWSITKSVTSLLVGIAQDEHLLAIDDPVAKYVPAWRGTASAGVTIRDILSNTSGRHWDQRTDYYEMAVRADDKTAYAVALGQDVPPGTRWVYNNSAVQVLEAVLRSATGQGAPEFTHRRLFDPAGMNDTYIESDHAGHGNVFAGMRTTCADLVRLGQLVLGHGSIDGEQVISSRYLAEALDGPSSRLNASYGLLWWLNGRGPAVVPDVATGGGAAKTEGPIAPEAPSDTMWALGFQGQILVVVPSRNAVAVRLGRMPPADAGFDVGGFTADVLSVLE